MATTTVNGLRIGYELLGDGAQPWVLTPGGRFPKETPGLRDLAEALLRADGRHRENQVTSAKPQVTGPDEFSAPTGSTLDATSS